MAEKKRKNPYRPAKAHDRRSRDLLRNAEVAAVEVDDPLALEPGEKIVTLRSIRNDPLARLHTHRQIDEAQYQGGRAFQSDWEKAERGPQAVDPTREYVDGGQRRGAHTEGEGEGGAPTPGVRSHEGICGWGAEAGADHGRSAQGRAAAEPSRA